MPTISIRFGVPGIFTAQSKLSPTTGGVSLKEVWTKQEPPYIVAKFKVLGANYSGLSVGDITELRIVMPPWSNGTQEVRKVSRAEVVGIKQHIALDRPETTSFKLKFYKIHQTSYDHECSVEHQDGQDCRGTVVVDPDNGPSYGVSI